MKRAVSLTLAIAMALLLFASAQAEVMLTWNELNGEDYGATVGAHAFAERVEALSGGELIVDLYTNGALGSEAESMQGLQMGTLDIFRGNASSLPDYGAELIGMTGMPYVFTGMEEFEAFSVSPLGRALLDSVEAADCGYVALAWLVEGPRSLFITEKAYQAIGEPEAITLDMLRDLNIRVPDTELMRQTMAALGAVSTPVTYAQLYTALQSGSVDGAENGVTSYLSSRFNEVAPYFITDAHTFGCGVILMSSASWNALGETEQGWLREAAQAASAACYAYNVRREQECFDSFEAQGITLLPVVDIERWQDACASLYEQQSEAARDVIARILDRQD